MKQSIFLSFVAYYTIKNQAKPGLMINTFFMVARAGFEPAIYGMKTRCPRPLDERAKLLRSHLDSLVKVRP